MSRTPHQALLLRALIVGVALALAAVAAAPASGDGLPVLGVDVGSQGVAARSGQVRYVAFRVWRDTIVARTSVAGGKVLGYTRLRGAFTIPAVAYDGSASGLSADGRTLILIEPRAGFPRARTAFAVLDAKRLVLRKVVTLTGDYSFDAISARGTTMFLIQYTSAKDPTRYNVRAYDVPGGRLFRNPVVDPNEHEDAMRGSPITRATSSNGRWAYTLYDGAGGTPFVHALDTEKRQARCIDLSMLVGRKDLGRLRLSLLRNGSSFAVGTPRETLALIDTSDFRVTVPGGQASSHYDSRRWLLLAIAVLATIATVLALSVAVRRLRARLTRAQHV